MTNPIEAIRPWQSEMEAIRRDIHAHPELGLEEHRTAELVARTLESYGIEVHRGVGKTGVVGVLRNGPGNKAIGLRADMDALPMTEMTGLPWASTVPGKMHACGHDGHTTMLLAAAKYLAQTRQFSGTVHFIFQPAEEGVGGAQAMLADGLLERFACDALFGLHNRPNLAVGDYAVCHGTAMAAGAFFDITLTGRGAHGAAPEHSVDPVLVACHLGTALQSIVSRNLSPLEAAVLSLTRISSGDAYNVIPQTAVLAGTARAFTDAAMARIEARMRGLADGVAAGFGATAAVDFRVIFAPLVNAPGPTGVLIQAANTIAGEAHVDATRGPSMASEDFSYMTQRVPGAYMLVGIGPSANLHNEAYDFNDAAITFGAALHARAAELSLPQ